MPAAGGGRRRAAVSALSQHRCWWRSRS
jgi:hypothetical protein